MSGAKTDNSPTPPTKGEKTRGRILDATLELIAEHGLRKNQVAIGKKVLREIIDGWAREAGVRSLENQIKKHESRRAEIMETTKLCLC